MIYIYNGVRDIYYLSFIWPAYQPGTAVTKWLENYLKHVYVTESEGRQLPKIGGRTWRFHLSATVDASPARRRHAVKYEERNFINKDVFHSTKSCWFLGRT